MYIMLKNHPIFWLFLVFALFLVNESHSYNLKPLWLLREKIKECWIIYICFIICVLLEQY